MELHPYLILHGQAAEALSFYKKALKLRITHSQTYNDSPLPVPRERKKWLVHGELSQGKDCFMMIADNPTANEGNATFMHLSLNFEELWKARRAFDMLAVGGTITAPLTTEIWGATFGQLTDRYGVRWMINCEKKRKQPSMPTF
ncbi:MAG: VOC family protein [Flavobacteriaceae bacterium]